jgi:hypothetical protein
MRTPGGASTGLKCHIAATDKCRIGRLKQRVKAHCAGEIVRRLISIVPFLYARQQAQRIPSSAAAKLQLGRSCLE